VEDSVRFLRGLKPYYERHHKVRYTADAIRAAVELSHRYINDRKLPDQAIDVTMNRVPRRCWCRRAAAARRSPPRKSDCSRTMARIPPKSVSRDDMEVLKNLERDLKTMVFGQDLAIEALASAIKLARAGLREAEKPIGSYLFLRPDRCGQDGVCRQLARTLGIEITRFDMSEYMERHTVSRHRRAAGLCWIRPGWLLTRCDRPASALRLLLDEIEKAHPDLFNISCK